MDLHLIPGAVASADERDAIDAVVGTSADRHLLLPALHAAQARIGWISEGALNHICAQLAVPPAEAYGVASFYAMFALKPRASRVVHVCDDIACRTGGAEKICRDLEQRIGHAGAPTAGGAATWILSPCLGLCEHAPVALVQSAGAAPADYSLCNISVVQIEETLRSAKTPGVISGLAASEMTPGVLGTPPSAPQTVAPRAPGLRLLRRVGVVDPGSLDEYRAHGGYAALRRAISLGPERTLREVTESKLVGRGGAAFPTGRKWEAVARSPVRPHYLVCNADESEPGTFKDRVLMESDPFAIIEAMTIGGFATASEQGFLYIRGEYPLATKRLSDAITHARTRGFLGDNIMGEGVTFDIELRRGAGAYICGEETALFNSIEGLRGEPRNKPPFPVQAGLFGKPTVVNNVETLANVLDIILAGGPAFANVGTAGSAGTKLFCVSGCATHPGLYEAPFGITLRELIAMAGGVRDGRALKSVLLGGAAGVFVTPDELDMPLTFEGTRAAGATLRLRRDHVVSDEHDRHVRHPAAHCVVFPRRVVRPMRPVPDRHDQARRSAAPADVSHGRQTDGDRARVDQRGRTSHARCVDLRTRPDGGQRRREWRPQTATLPIARITMMEAVPAQFVRQVEVTIDGQQVRVLEGTTILQACKSVGIETPTLCYLETLTPVNVCRVCVVEVEGARTLVPACSRPVEAGMKIQTDSERVRLSRRLVFELLGSSVDLSLATPEFKKDMARYNAAPERFGEGHHATSAQPVKVDNNLYVRDYSKCVLCYKCVEACGTDAQIRSRVRSPAAASRRRSPRSSKRRCPIRRASTAATASACVPPAR